MSHIPLKSVVTDMMSAAFGCVFCCYEGKGTPVFGGVHAFLAHLQEHRDRLPEGEVLYRMKCIAGRMPQQDEDFNVALPPLQAD